MGAHRAHLPDSVQPALPSYVTTWALDYVSNTPAVQETTRISQLNLNSAEVGPWPGEGNGESVSIAGHHTTEERDDTLRPGSGP